MFHLSVYNTYFRVNTNVTSPSPCFFSAIYIAQVSFASMLKGLIEYLIYLLFSSGRDVFIQVEKVYQDIPFFGAQGDLKGIETLSVFLFSAASRLRACTGSHSERGRKIDEEPPPPPPQKKPKTKTKLEETRVVKGFPLVFPVYDSTHPSPLLYLNAALYYLNAWNKLSRLSPT